MRLTWHFKPKLGTTGDLGERLPDGWRLLGRKREVYKRCSEKSFPDHP